MSAPRFPTLRTRSPMVGTTFPPPSLTPRPPSLRTGTTRRTVSCCNGSNAACDGFAVLPSVPGVDRLHFMDGHLLQDLMCA